VKQKNTNKGETRSYIRTPLPKLIFVITIIPINTNDVEFDIVLHRNNLLLNCLEMSRNKQQKTKNQKKIIFNLAHWLGFLYIFPLVFINFFFLQNFHF
jgi:hypothetical protein